MARDVLFDLAVNRAHSYARRLRLLEQHPDLRSLSQALQPWYLRTRFAYRLRLEDVSKALLTCPGAGYHWAGGQQGSWQAGQAPQP